VACVGDERSLAFERRLEPHEHVVQAIAEARDLVVGPWHGKAAARACSRDRRGALAHPLDRAQGGSSEEVRGERGEQQCNRTADHKLVAQVGKRGFARLQRRADDDDHSLSLRCDRHPEQTHGLAIEHSDEEARTSECAAELSGGKKRLTRKAWRPIDDGPARLDHLGESVVRSVQGSTEARVGLLGERSDDRRTCAQTLVDSSVERRPCADVQKETGRREHDRHRSSKPQGQPNPDREAAHHVPFRSR